MTLEEYTHIKSRFEEFKKYITNVFKSEIIESHILSYEECKFLPKDHQIFYILEKYRSHLKPSNYLMIKWFMGNDKDKIIKNNLTVDIINEFCLRENT